MVLGGFMDTKISGLMLKHKVLLRLVVLSYITIAFLDRFTFGFVELDVFIRSGLSMAVVLKLISFMIVISGLIGFILKKIYFCVFFILFSFVENLTILINEILLIHRHFALYTSIVLRDHLFIIYGSFLLNVFIIMFGLFLMYIDKNNHITLNEKLSL